MRRDKGFTLIELAIVLVIIGIILGMVLKGQDLIQNARMKKLVNEVRKWEVALWTCFDRTGRFPGDTDGDGLIDDQDPLDTSNCTDAACNCFRNLANAPSSHNINLGSNTFYIYLGVDSTTNGKNIIAVCVSQDCTSSMDDVTIDFARVFDTSLDGTVDDRLGIVRGATSVTTAGTSPNYRINGVTIPDTTTDTTTDWDSGTDKAIVYYFDRKP